MPSHAVNKVAILGCGNVAWHLAKQLQALKHFSVTVYNHRSTPALHAFKKQLGCNIQSSLNHIERDADHYFVCVADKAIAAVSKKILCDKAGAVVAHTSGSAELKELQCKHPNKAVLYPLQTFSKQDVLDWNNIPLIIETANAITKTKIKAFSQQLSAHIHFYNYQKRLTMHLAAVFVNNFTNALYVAAGDLVSEKNSNNFKLLLPLIQQTTRKLGRLAPLDAQTGPAKRNDTVVLKKHKALLKGNKDLEKLYTQLSQLILKQQAHAQL